MKEFIVNEYITLKLENDETNIYVKNKLFSQCKYILLQDLRVDEVDEYVRLFNSVDEQAEILDHSLERKDNTAIHLSPEDEFWAHCSNLQIWVEQNYDTRLLHSNLAFPLLRKLYEEKVPVASIAFKEEIAERFANGYIPTIFYILEEGYLKYLDKKEMYEICFLDKNVALKKAIYTAIKSNTSHIKYVLPILTTLSKLGDFGAKSIIERNFSKIINDCDLNCLLFLINNEYFDEISQEDFKIEWFLNRSDLRNYIQHTLTDEKFHQNYPESYRKFPFSLLRLFYNKNVSHEKNFIVNDIVELIDLRNKTFIEFLIKELYIQYFPKSLIKNWLFSINHYKELFELY